MTGPWWWRLAILCVGGALGANARYWVSVAIQRWVEPRYPWATFTINVTGSLAIGILAGLLAQQHPHSGPRLLVIVGFLGSYTTFSTYALDGLVLFERGEVVAALVYLLGSIAVGLVAVVCGLALAGPIVRLFGSG
jgi:CrcB protein